MKKVLVAILLAFFIVSNANAYNTYYQNGYRRSNGTYVRGHYKTRADSNPYNNLGSRTFKGI